MCEDLSTIREENGFALTIQFVTPHILQNSVRIPCSNVYGDSCRVFLFLCCIDASFFWVAQVS